MENDLIMKQMNFSKKRPCVIMKINFREVVCKVRIKNDQIQGELFETWHEWKLKKIEIF